jgi:hypothetical protein
LNGIRLKRSEDGSQKTEERAILKLILPIMENICKKVINPKYNLAVKKSFRVASGSRLPTPDQILTH